MAEGKKSFVLYADYKHTFDLLTDEQAGKLIKHLLRYVNDENPEMDDILLKVAFEPIKRQLKRDLVDWETKREKRVAAGHVGGLKSGESRQKKQTKQMLQKESKSEQSQANEAVNVNGNVNVTVNGNTNTIPSETWDGIKLKWKSDWRWIDKFCMDNGNLDRLFILKKMDDFLADLDTQEDFKQIPGLKKHFFYWYKKHHDGSTKNIGNSATGSAKLGTSDARTEALRKW